MLSELKLRHTIQSNYSSLYRVYENIIKYHCQLHAIDNELKNFMLNSFSNKFEFSTKLLDLLNLNTDDPIIFSFITNGYQNMKAKLSVLTDLKYESEIIELISDLNEFLNLPTDSLSYKELEKEVEKVNNDPSWLGNQLRLGTLNLTSSPHFRQGGDNRNYITHIIIEPKNFLEQEKLLLKLFKSLYKMHSKSQFNEVIELSFADITKNYTGIKKEIEQELPFHVQRLRLLPFNYTDHIVDMDQIPSNYEDAKKYYYLYSKVFSPLQTPMNFYSHGFALIQGIKRDGVFEYKTPFVFPTSTCHGMSHKMTEKYKYITSKEIYPNFILLEELFTKLYHTDDYINVDDLDIYLINETLMKIVKCLIKEKVDEIKDMNEISVNVYLPIGLSILQSKSNKKESSELITELPTIYIDVPNTDYTIPVMIKWNRCPLSSQIKWK